MTHAEAPPGLRESWCALRLGFFCTWVCSLCLSIWDPQPVALALRCRFSVAVRMTDIS